MEDFPSLLQFHLLMEVGEGGGEFEFFEERGRYRHRDLSHNYQLHDKSTMALHLSNRIIYTYYSIKRFICHFSTQRGGGGGGTTWRMNPARAQARTTPPLTKKALQFVRSVSANGPTSFFLINASPMRKEEEEEEEDQEENIYNVLLPLCLLRQILSEIHSLCSRGN